ncbi:hypothetical protein [Burkholderia gladioli]|uniref:hypothetical protein n=1 Tax=Burkholderia gladioli TaxID=28095 RepID=UPI0034DB34DF
MSVTRRQGGGRRLGRQVRGEHAVTGITHLEKYLARQLVSIPLRAGRLAGTRQLHPRIDRRACESGQVGRVESQQEIRVFSQSRVLPFLDLAVDQVQAAEYGKQPDRADAAKGEQGGAAPDRATAHAGSTT